MKTIRTDCLKGLLDKYKVLIPPIQRDYAQGRNTKKIQHIREKFIDDIVCALSEEDTLPLELDFIYGYEESDELQHQTVRVFKPLDGQQRLTTLFLIHWYIDAKENKLNPKQNNTEVANDFLNRFSYATRKSSRDFCEKLIKFIPSFNGFSVDEEIVNQPWFYSSWKSDPTINSMLVVLRTIEEKFIGLDDVWNKLTGPDPRIIFYLLPMEDLGLPDDLYIKMNARGKSLTDFEHFKSRFSEIIGEEFKEIFNEKIDKQWSDLFWNIFKNKKSDNIAKEVDNGFLSFFWYITDLLIKKNNIDIKSEFWLDRVKEIYGDSSENIEFLFYSLDLFENLEKSNPNYFENIFYINREDFAINKTRIFFNNPQVNLFHKCAETYGFEEKKNSFSVAEQLMLYAFIYMNMKGALDNNKFRFIRNIFASSEDQLRNEYLGKFLYSDIESIIDHHNFSENSKLVKRQFEEEKEKTEFISDHPKFKETVFRLEDHHLLRGNIAILEIDKTIVEYANCFNDVFKSGCDYFAISRALLTIGDYSQDYGKKKRFGNKTNSTWRELLTPSDYRKNFNETKSVLNLYLTLLIKNSDFDNDYIISEYNKEFDNDLLKPKDWKYYYVRYDNFRMWNNKHQTNGFYFWTDLKENPYKCFNMFRTQFNGRHWDPYLLEISFLNPDCTIENYGSDLQFTCNDIILLISNINNGFRFYTAEEDIASERFLAKLISSNQLSEKGELLIQQNEDNIDTQDRIQVCNVFLNDLVNLINP